MLVSFLYNNNFYDTPSSIYRTAQCMLFLVAPVPCRDEARCDAENCENKNHLDAESLNRVARNHEFKRGGLIACQACILYICCAGRRGWSQRRELILPARTSRFLRVAGADSPRALSCTGALCAREG